MTGSVASAVCAALVLLFLLGARAQSPVPSPSTYPEFARGRVFGLVKKNVVTNALPRSAAKNVQEILEFFKKLQDEVSDDLKKSESGDNLTNLEIRTCNIPNDGTWGTKVEEYLEVRGLGEVTTDCSTEFEIKEEAERDKKQNERYPKLDEYLPAWANDLESSASKISQNAGNYLKGAVAGVSRFWYPDRESQNCTLWHTMGLRSKDRWYLQVRVTADNGTKTNNANSDNDFLVEHITVSNGVFQEPLEMNVPKYKNATKLWPATTTFEVWSRPAPDSVGVNTDIARNLAFRSALSKGDNENQQAVDARQGSNIAILILPLAMNLVPVALIADVNTLGMLLYTVLTDVLTTIPLCIKGFELIDIANNHFSATSAQITGKPDMKEVSFAEAWVVRCQLQDSAEHRTVGIVFVVISFVLMAFGIVCEFTARWWVRKRRAEEQIPLAAGGDAPSPGYGSSSSYQPFTAAALTLQNRVASRTQRGQQPQQGVAAMTRSTGAHTVPNAGMHSGAYGITPAHGPGLTVGNEHGRNCACACHSVHHAVQGHEYDARPNVDPLERKYI